MRKSGVVALYPFYLAVGEKILIYIVHLHTSGYVTLFASSSSFVRYSTKTFSASIESINLCDIQFDSYFVVVILSA